MFRIGEKVQAVDELGRWELGKVVAVEGDRPTVKFFGWDEEYNVQPGKDEVRKPIDYRTYTLDQPKEKRKVKKVNHMQVGLLRSLCKGDAVLVAGVNGPEEAEVLQVDQFKRIVKVFLQGSILEVTANAIQVEEEQNKEPEAKKPRKQHQRCSQPTAVAQGSLSITQSEGALDGQSESDDDIKEGFFEISTNSGIVTCGSVYKVKPQGLNVVVKDLQHCKGQFKAVCLLVDQDTDGVDTGVDNDVTLILPASRLEPVTVTLARKERKLMDSIAHKQVENFMLHMKEDFAFRKLARANDIARVLRREIKAGLNCKTHRRTFSLGLCCAEIDLNLLGLDFFAKKRSVFSYRDSTLDKVDSLLGNGWDVVCSDEQTKFVTQLVVWLRDGIVHGTVYTSVCPEVLLGANYREQLKRHIAEARLSIPADDAFTGTE